MQNSPLYRQVKGDLEQLNNDPAEEDYWHIMTMMDDLYDKTDVLLGLIEMCMRVEFNSKALIEMKSWWEKNYGTTNYQGSVVKSIFRGRGFGELSTISNFRDSAGSPIRFKNERTGKEFGTIAEAYLDELKSSNITTSDLNELQQWISYHRREINSSTPEDNFDREVERTAKSIQKQAKGYKKLIVKKTKIDVSVDECVSKLFPEGYRLVDVLVNEEVDDLRAEMKKYTKMRVETEKKCVTEATRIFTQLKTFKQLSKNTKGSVPKSKTTPPVLNHFIDDVLETITLPGYGNVGEQVVNLTKSSTNKKKLDYFYEPQKILKDFKNDLYRQIEDDDDISFY